MRILGSLLVAQLALMGVALAVPQFRMSAMLISFIVCTSALITFCWLLVSAHRIRVADQKLQSDRSASDSRAIEQIVEELEPLNRGDLRVRASLPDQPQVARLSRTINHAVTELRWLVGRCQEFAGRMDVSVELPRSQMRELRNDHRGQAAEIHESANALAAMTSAMSSLSAATRNASAQARHAAQESSRAGRLISDGEGRALRIREHALNSVRTVNRLSRSATSANVLTGSIAEVARRADLLALNSTLQITTQSSSGGQLVHLAEEVSELASLLGTTSGDLAHLIDTIQQDSTDVMGAVQQINSDLSSGRDQLNQLGSTLDSVGRSSTQLQALVDEMAEKTLLQTRVVKRVYARMVSINDLSDSYSSGARAWATSLDELQSIALELQSSVADFQLPSVPESAASRGGASSSEQRRQTTAAAVATDTAVADER